MKRSVSIFYLASMVASGTLAAKRPFSVHDDVLAYPQYNISFPEEYVLQSEVDTILQLQKDRAASTDSSSSSSSASSPSSTPNIDSDKRDLQSYASQRPIGGWKSTEENNNNKGGAQNLDWDPQLSLDHFSYEEMKLDGLRYLCSIPRVSNTAEHNMSAPPVAENEARNQTQEENEISRATDRGLELLQDMEGTCMYYVSGWWSYSFCYKRQVKQFHARSGPGVPNYPPIEDPATHSFVLGQFQGDDDDELDPESNSKRTTTSPTELQTKGESRHLVQRLGGGTVCDLTGAERKVEVQFHCNPQSTDRIGLIKEIATCSYLMVIYTPRLCHDIAFQLPKLEETHSIECREILAPEEIEDFEAMKAHHDRQKLVNSGVQLSQFVGGIEVGAKKDVGSEGKVIEKGRMARIGEESVRVLAQRENGKVSKIPNEELKKWGLDPEEVDSLRKQIDQQAKGNDWKLEVVESHADISYRGIIAANAEDDEGKEKVQTKDEQPSSKKDSKENEDTPSDEETGSKETLKDEL